MWWDYLQKSSNVIINIFERIYSDGQLYLRNKNEERCKRICFGDFLMARTKDEGFSDKVWRRRAKDKEELEGTCYLKLLGAQRLFWELGKPSRFSVVRGYSPVSRDLGIELYLQHHRFSSLAFSLFFAKTWRTTAKVPFTTDRPSVIVDYASRFSPFTKFLTYTTVVLLFLIEWLLQRVLRISFSQVSLSR